MAQIAQLSIGITNVYPQTITDAIYDFEQQKTLTDILKEIRDDLDSGVGAGGGAALSLTATPSFFRKGNLANVILNVNISGPTVRKVTVTDDKGRVVGEETSDIGFSGCAFTDRNISRTITYTAVATLANGKTLEPATVQVRAINPLFYGAGKTEAAATNERVSLSASGSYDFTTAQNDYVFFLIPEDVPFNPSSATLQGFNFPLSLQGTVTKTIGRDTVTYSIYRSNQLAATDLTVVL